MLRLHRPDWEGAGWQVSGTDLFVFRAEDHFLFKGAVPAQAGFVLDCPSADCVPGGLPGKHWMTRHELDPASRVFATRRELLQVLTALHACDPIPAGRFSYEPLRTERMADGLHMSVKGYWIFRRLQSGQWEFEDMGGGQLRLAPTLRSARAEAAGLTPKEHLA